MLINHLRGSCSLLPGRWVCSGPWHRACIAREAQIRALQMPWPFQSHPRLGSGQVTSVQARGQRARQGLGEVDTLNQKCHGAAPESVPRADPSSHTDGDADTILCGYPAGVKTWGMPGGQLRSVLANANLSMWLPQLLQSLWTGNPGAAQATATHTQLALSVQPSFQDSHWLSLSRKESRQHRHQMCARQTNSK